MVYRPRCLDSDRNRPIQIKFEQSSNQLSILYSDGSRLLYSARGIYKFDACGNYNELFPGARGVRDERLL